jgi:hypothetical protein
LAGQQKKAGTTMGGLIILATVNSGDFIDKIR